MALKRTVDDIKTVPEVQRSLYTENETGGWTLDVEGGIGDDTAALKEALKKSRESESLAKKYKELFPDKTPAEVLEIVKAAEKTADDKKGGKGKGTDEDVERIIEKRVAEANKKLADAEARATDAETKLRNRDMDAVTRAAFLKAKGLAESVDDAVELSRKHFDLRDGKVVVLDEDGDPTSMSPEKFFATTFKEKKAYLYQGTGASGSGATGSTSKTGTGKTDAPSSPTDKIAAGLAAQQR